MMTMMHNHALQRTRHVVGSSDAFRVAGSLSLDRCVDKAIAKILHMEASSGDFLERVWEQREGQIYPEIFGSTGKGIFPLSIELFTNQFGQTAIDPRWLTVGVFECPPTQNRSGWVYVSSRLSNPWESDEREEVSGIGCEFLFEVSESGTWAIQRIQELSAYQILLSNGRYGDRALLEYWDRIPLRRSVMPDYDSEIRNLILHPPSRFPEVIDLESGKVMFIEVTGITDQELQFAKANDSDKLLVLLQNRHVTSPTNPRRKSIM